MHISDGVLSAPVWVGAAAVTAGGAAVLLRRVRGEQIPRVALCTSFFFVASLVHVPVGPTSVHLLLIGLVGIIMRELALLPILFGLILQALLFQHGGVTTLGANALVMGLPAYAAWGVFALGRAVRGRAAPAVFGFLAGAVAVLLAALMLAALLATTDETFRTVAGLAFVVHLPVAAVEGVVTGFAAAFLMKVEPGLLEARSA